MLLLFMLAAAPHDPSIERAVAYLSREVPRWSRENHCYSCHNNGDAARALYVARRAGYRVPASALADTTKWLRHPALWDANRGNPAFSDKGLARIQFAAALVEASGDGAALSQAAQTLVADQKADGSWQVDAGSAAGSPATYGPYLATYMARRALEAAGGFGGAVLRANAWFATAAPTSVLDRAALMLAVPARRDEAILDAQNPDGGWGPFRDAPSEVFDTAVVLLALKGNARGRAWIVNMQTDSGDWPETTRPSGGQSYAEHISTAGWATLALLATAP